MTVRRVLGRRDAVLSPLQAVIAYMVQLFFAWRIFRLTSNFLVTLVIVLCSTIQMRPFLQFRTSAAPS
jgi:hypothetical protein